MGSCNRYKKGFLGRCLCFLLLLLLLTSCASEGETKQATRPQSEILGTEATTDGYGEEILPSTMQTEPASSEERKVDPALAGRYECVASYWQGESCETDESWYELREDGTGTEFRITEWTFTWEVDGNTLVMTDLTGRETRGRIEGDTLTVDDALLGTKNVYSRKPINSVETMPTEPLVQITEEVPSLSTGDTEQDDLYAYWNRGWYGWWVVEEGAGAYSAWGNGSYWWDCCADIIWHEDNSLSLILWDEDGSRQEPMAEARLLWDFQRGTYGTAYSTEGYFWNREISENEWEIDPDKANYDELLILEGHYVDPNGKGDAFYYTVYLRPWGKLWDDWYADEAGCLPEYYESWYLPKLAQGVVSPPDKIG